MARKVQINLVGGVGNQLFTYSAGYFLSLQRGVEFHPRILKPAFGDTQHSSSINDLSIFPKVTEISGWKSKYWRIISRFRRELLRYLPIMEHFLESRKYSSNVIGYDEKFDSTSADEIEGYFQTFKYIQRILETQPNFLNLEVESPSEWYLKTKKEIASEQIVGIHVRGGDYLREINRPIGNLSSEYYENAVKLLQEIVDADKFKYYIFTDDPEYAKKLLGNVSFSSRMKVVVPPRDSKPTESLLLMSQAQVQVISNSTFAWWSGYLGSKNSLVIAPSKWFKEKDDPSYLIPENWRICESTWSSKNSIDKVVKS